MKTYLIEYIHAKTQVKLTTHMSAEDKTEARDLFYKNYPDVTEVERITWVPTIEEQ